MLTAYLLAEKWVAGEDAWPLVNFRVNETGGKTYHLFVGSPFGVQDPSLILGMR